MKSREAFVTFLRRVERALEDSLEGLKTLGQWASHSIDQRQATLTHLARRVWHWPLPVHQQS
jgi:hypothetical protein